MLSAAIIFGCIMCLVGVVTVLLVPVVFGNLSIDAQNICRAMLLLMALFMPLWTYAVSYTHLPVHIYNKVRIQRYYSNSSHHFLLKGAEEVP